MRRVVSSFPADEHRQGIPVDSSAGNFGPAVDGRRRYLPVGVRGFATDRAHDDMTTNIDIRYAHSGDLTTNQAHELEWCEGGIGERYQEIAIVGDRVIGAWSYEPKWERGRLTIDSQHTGVMPRYRRRGVAQALWMHGLARWRPRRIEAMIGTDEGRDFLARMTARLAFAMPDTFLWVKRRDEDRDVWDALCENASRRLLNQLGRDRIAATKKLPKTAAPALLKAG